MRLTLTPSSIAQVRPNRQYVPGRDLMLPYVVELDPADYPVGATTIVAASLVVESDFGGSPLFTLNITPAPSADGQITDTAADGLGALYFALDASTLLSYRDAPIVYEVVVTDSRGLQGSLDAGVLVAATSTAGKPVDHITIAPTLARLDLGQTQQLTVTAFDADGDVLTGRVVTYQSSVPSVASVSTSGLVTGLTIGSAAITATIEGKSAATTINIPAVDHVTILPVLFSLAFPAEEQMSATAYDIDGNVLTRALQWSSADPTVATVSSTGLVDAAGSGSTQITVTVEGKTAHATVTASVPAPLALTLDAAYLTTPTDLEDPTIITTNTGRSGIQDGVPQHLGAGLLNTPTNSVARVPYPKSSTEWGFAAAVDGPMSSTFTPSTSFTASNVLVDGPYPNTGAYSILPSDGSQHNTQLDTRWTPLATPDSQDASDFKRSLGCALLARTAGDIGKTVRVNLMQSADFPGGNGWKEGITPRVKFTDVVLTAAWQSVALTFDSAAQQAACVNPILTISMPVGVIAGYIVAPYMARAWQAEDATPENWYRPAPFHHQLGVQSTDIYCQCVAGDSDLPALYGPTPARIVSAVPAPDSARYHGGRFYSEYTLNQGDGIDLGVLRIEDGGGSPPALTNVPVKSAWAHWQIKPKAGEPLPSDTDFALYLAAIGSGTVAEDAVQRADNVASPGNLDVGGAWQIGSGVWGVSGNTLQLQSHVAEDYIYVDTGQSDCTVEATLSTTNDDGDVEFRIVDTNNRYRLLWESGTLRIDKWVAGVFHFSIVSTAVALTAGDRVGVVLSGTTISPTHNGTVIPALVITDAFNATATKHGLGAANTGPRFSHFKVTATSFSAHTYGPFPLLRDSTRHGLAFGSCLVGADGEQNFRVRATFNLAAEGYLDFRGRIVKVSAGTSNFLGYRAAVTTEGGRGMGLHSAWAPKRTVTGRSFADSAFEVIPNIQKIMTPATLLWGIRQVQPFSFGDLENINGATGTDTIVPSLWQSGPYGSADYFFHAEAGHNGDGTFYLEIMVARGSPTPDPQDFMSWSIRINGMSLAQAAIAWPQFVAYDVWCASQNGIPILFGLGLGAGPGSGITWLADGDTFLGGTVVFAHAAGAAWTFDGGNYNDCGHMGVNADLDRVRESGWYQGIAAGNVIDDTVPNLKTRIAYHAQRRWKARKDHRLALP